MATTGTREITTSISRAHGKSYATSTQDLALSGVSTDDTGGTTRFPYSPKQNQEQPTTDGFLTTSLDLNSPKSDTSIAHKPKPAASTSHISSSTATGTSASSNGGSDSKMMASDTSTSNGPHFSLSVAVDIGTAQDTKSDLPNEAHTLRSDQPSGTEALWKATNIYDATLSEAGGAYTNCCNHDQQRADANDSISQLC